MTISLWPLRDIGSRICVPPLSAALHALPDTPEGHRRARRLLQRLWQRQTAQQVAPQALMPFPATTLWCATPPRFLAHLDTLPTFVDSLSFALSVPETLYFLFDTPDSHRWWRGQRLRLWRDKLSHLPVPDRSGARDLLWRMAVLAHGPRAQHLWRVLDHLAAPSLTGLAWTAGRAPPRCAYKAADALARLHRHGDLHTTISLEDADTFAGQIRLWCVLESIGVASTSTTLEWLETLLRGTAWTQDGLLRPTAHSALRRARLIALHTPSGWIDRLPDTAPRPHAREHLSVWCAEVLAQAFEPPRSVALPSQRPQDPYATTGAAIPPRPACPEDAHRCAP